MNAIVATYPYTTALGRIVDMPIVGVPVIKRQLVASLEGRTEDAQIILIRQEIKRWEWVIDDSKHPRVIAQHGLYIDMAEKLMDEMNLTETGVIA